MKFILPQLKKDQRVWALVQDIIEDCKDLIVSFQGDLIRVQNHSSRRFRPGQRIQLQVYNVEPLAFKLIETRKTFNLDISI